MPDRTPPAGLSELEGVVSHTTVPIITLPVATVRELIAWARAMEREIEEGRWMADLRAPTEVAAS
jgi:hypothetical protein